MCNGPVLPNFREGEGGEVGLCVKRGVPWLGEVEPNAGLCGGHPKVTLAGGESLGARSCGDNSEASLSEFYYHSNEAVERYFI